MTQQQNKCNHQYSVFLKYINSNKLKKYCSFCYEVTDQIKLNTCVYRSVPILQQTITHSESSYGNIKTTLDRSESELDLSNIHDHYRNGTFSKDERYSSSQLKIVLKFSAVLLTIVLILTSIHIHSAVPIFFLLCSYFIIMISSWMIGGERLSHLEEQAIKERKALNKLTPIAKIEKHEIYNTDRNTKEYQDLKVCAVKLYEWNKWIMSLKRSDNSIDRLKNYLIKDIDLIKIHEKNESPLWQNLFLQYYDINCETEFLDFNDKNPLAEKEGIISEIRLAELIRSDNANNNVKIEAINLLNDQDILCLLTKIVESSELREILIQKITSDKLIQDIAHNASFHDIRSMAIDKISDFYFLMELVKYELDNYIINKVKDRIITLLDNINKKSKLRDIRNLTTSSDNASTPHKIFDDNYYDDAPTLRKFKIQTRDEIVKFIDDKILSV